jgi:hypothetical protein
MPRPSQRRLFAIFGLLIIAAGFLGAYDGLRYRNYLAEAWAIPVHDVTLFKTDYWMGELVQSIVEHGEYRGCYPSPVSAQPATVGLCMSAHRMPVVPLFMSLVAVIVNDVVFYDVVKAMLSMVLLCMAAWLVLRQTDDWRIIGGALLAVYVLCPPNIQMLLAAVSEESYFIPEMALAGALLFSRRRGHAEISKGALIGLSILVAAMPMTKSSGMLPAAVIAVLLALRPGPQGFVRLLPIGALALVLLGWGAFTYKATGHFAFGNTLSSLNGYNLHHGYTKDYGEVAPRYHLDVPVWRGNIKLNAPVQDEWEMNKQFTDRTVAFMRDNPGTVLWYLVVKAYAAVFKVTPEYRLQSGEDGLFIPKHLIVTAGLILDRAILWLSVAAALAVCWRAVRSKGWKFLNRDEEASDACMLLLVTFAYLAPFVIAFSHYRHIVPLYYFQVPYLASVLLRSSLLQQSNWGAKLNRLVGRPATANG